MAKREPVRFTPNHHALLFAWIAREVVQTAGQAAGQAAVRKAVRRYGEQRGSRMRQRAENDGIQADMTSYMAYGEWRAEPGSFEQARDSLEGTPRGLVFRCPWHEAWLAGEVNETGRLYCLEIDPALARGFNPDLRLEVNGTRSNGAEACQFLYHQADLERLGKIQVDPEKTVMGWDYHLGHLWKTMREVLVAELGKTGESAVQVGMQVFADQFGEEAARRVTWFEETDFNQLPG